MKRKVLVIGGGIQGVQSALKLADSGVDVTLVESSPSLHAGASQENRDSDIREALPVLPDLLRASSHQNINVITCASLAKVEGEKGAFKANITVQPRYVDAADCASCGRCEIECPVELLPVSGDKNQGRKAIRRPALGLKSVPSTFNIEKLGIAPCSAACPAGIHTYGYVALVSQGKFAEALDLITQAVAFPRVLGRVCNHPCETACTRGKIDRAVSICALKRFVADNNSTTSSLKRSHNNGGAKLTGPSRVAIIGAGPAGLTAARDLARMGHRSTVFEALPVPGGMISVGMPRFRLPREIRQADVADIVNLGIEIKTSTPIGKDLTMQDLKKQGFEAILIASGAHKNQKLGIPGETLSGVIDSVVLLRALNLKQLVVIGKKVVVVGGGYTAIDSARTAVRLNCQQVQVLYRRSLEEMPANAEEVQEAVEEGVKVQYLVAPVRILGEGKVTGVECIRMKLGEADKSGRRRPIPIEGSEFTIEADTVIVAVGQRPDLSFLEGDETLTEGRRHIMVDRFTMETKIPGIFAAGDVTRGTGTLVEAIAAGRKAAISIDKFLRRKPVADRRPRERVKPVEVNLDEKYIPPIAHQEMPCLPFKDRIGNFEEVDLGYTREAAIMEAQRCLRCAGCSECLECVRVCELDAVDHAMVTANIDMEFDAIVVSGGTAKPAGTHPGEGAVVPGLTARQGTYWLPAADSEQAEAIMEKAMLDLTDGRQAVPLTVNVVKPAAARVSVPRVGVFVCRCGGSISETVDVAKLVESSRKVKDVVLSREVGYACTIGAADEIKSAASEHNLSHVVLASCVCCNLDQICLSCSDRRIKARANLMKSDGVRDVYYEFVNIREQCAWVHNDMGEATDKAKTMINAAVLRAVKSPDTAGTIANVDAARCRGCGTCVTVCPFKAVTLNGNGTAVSVAQVDEKLCKSCGVCVAHCPSGAMSQNSYTDEQITASLEAMLK